MCLGLIDKHLAKLERPSRDKHSSLLIGFANYNCNKFYNVGPRRRDCTSFFAVTGDVE